MRILTLALIAVLGTTSSGCGGESGPADSSDSGAEAEPSAATHLVDRALIDSCAGFDATKAGSMLGLPSAELEVLESFSERFGGQTCRYWSAGSNIGPGISILLNVQDSSEAAARLLASQRRMVPAVEAVPTGSTAPSAGPALLEFEGIGDEAFWDTNTGGVNVRVRNIVATIHASLSSTAISDRDAAQIELERRVAEEVAAGLQP